MGKIVGKGCALLLCFYVFLSNAGIRLEMRTGDGIEDNSAIVGQPFIIEAIIDEVQGSVQAPHIEGLEKLNARRTGMYMSSINGASITKYTYQVRIDQEGSYTIGPARLVHQHQQLVSNNLIVSVEKDGSLTSRARAKKSKKSEIKAFLRLMVDSDRVVVGQKVRATLRFYYQDSSVSLVNIAQPDIVGFDVKPVEKPIGGTVEVNGVHYKYAEWHWEMYPTQMGELVIPAYSIDYEIPLKNTHSMGSFFMFLNARTDRKRVYSNAINITVDPLPHSQIPVNAIGQFDTINATINPSVAKEGEGMVLTIEVGGSGNIHAVQLSPLNMPAELKYYDSHISITGTPMNDEYFHKKFEFIVQGMKSGDWEIPEQSFVYFDVNKQTYVTLKTSPLFVSIQSVGSKVIAPVAYDQHNSVEENIDDQLSCIAPINSKGPWYPISERTAIPWIIFYCILCVPMICIGYPIVGQGLLKYEIMKRRQRRKACKNVCKKIEFCMNTQDDKNIHFVFIELFAFLMNQSSFAISGDGIERYLKERGFSDYDVQEWHTFFEAIVYVSYAQSDKNKVQELCRIAIQWLKRLEKLV